MRGSRAEDGSAGKRVLATASSITAARVRSLRRLRRLLIDYHRSAAADAAVTAAICLAAGSPPRFPSEGKKKMLCVCRTRVDARRGATCRLGSGAPRHVGGKIPAFLAVSPRHAVAHTGSERKAENTRVHLQSCRGQSSTTQMHRSEKRLQQEGSSLKVPSSRQQGCFFLCEM